MAGALYIQERSTVAKQLVWDGLEPDLHQLSVLQQAGRGMKMRAATTIIATFTFAKNKAAAMVELALPGSGTRRKGQGWSPTLNREAAALPRSCAAFDRT